MTDQEENKLLARFSVSHHRKNSHVTWTLFTVGFMLVFMQLENAMLELNAPSTEHK